MKIITTKNLRNAIAIIALSMFTASAFADIPLKSGDEVNGVWVLQYTKKSPTSADTLKREDTWAFKDNKVTITHIPRDGTYFDQSPVTYIVEDGKLKISLLGRPDKFDIFSLFEKDDKSMTLKGKYGDVYHFVKK